MTDASVVCDLDGVVYRGNTAVPGAKEALLALTEAGVPVLFVTNNSARPPEHVVEKLARVVGFETTPDRVVTSSVVAASLIEAGPVLVMGEVGLERAVTLAGFDLTQDPDRARTVVVGLDRHLNYERAATAADAARNGAKLIVSNRDPTFPVENGLKPGAGACAALVETAAGITGVTAGKPTRAMRSLVEKLVPTGPLWMIGDRPDTDIALATGPRWTSILVMTGVTTDPALADPQPDLVAEDLLAAARLVLSSREAR
ncbi:MAG TPA: HAD-IIA family hydrolase [Acidimicrobiia bacterium]|nr:HAD-IIA family hydrolase [Acidimicrobiia bacterium]